MGKWKWTVDAFVNPPDKVMKMFDAVLELVSEKAELTSLKVQDITTRAGIGKGTAYEYFDSREDIILFALLYDYSKKIQRLQQRFQKQDSFQEQCYLVMDWLVENGEYNSAIMGIDADLHAEETERKAADAELAVKLAAETKARTDADTALDIAYKTADTWGTL